MGYITNRDGRWYAVNCEGLDPLTDRDRRRWHRASDEAAARALADTLPSARHPSARGMTVSRYLCTRWLPTRQDRLLPTTAFRYEKMIDRYVLPHIGLRPSPRVRPDARAVRTSAPTKSPSVVIERIAVPLQLPVPEWVPVSSAVVDTRS